MKYSYFNSSILRRKSLMSLSLDAHSYSSLTRFSSIYLITYASLSSICSLSHPYKFATSVLFFSATVCISPTCRLISSVRPFNRSSVLPATTTASSCIHCLCLSTALDTLTISWDLCPDCSDEERMQSMQSVSRHLSQKASSFLP